MRRGDHRTQGKDYDGKICEKVWTSHYAKRLMDELSYDIGPRPVGSKAMCEASGLVMNDFRKVGASNVHAENVPVFAWRSAPSTVELTAPKRRVYDSLHHVHTAAAKVTGPVLEAGTGRDEQLDALGERVEGAILLICGHEIAGSAFVPLQVRIENICKRGAVGILIRNEYPSGCPAIEVIGVSRDTPVPVVGISWEDAHELCSFAQSGRARIHLETAGKSYHTKCVNTIAELGPSRPTDEIVLLSAHMDCFDVNPGSFDNLTGVVTLLEIARALASFQSKFRRRLRLIVYTGEETVFQGSKSYIRDHREELDRVSFVFNMDSLWAATAEGVAVMWSPPMRDYIAAAFQETQRFVDARNMFCMSSDYLPFMLEGIAAARPAGFENSSFPPWSHTRLDTPDKVPADWLRLNAMTYAQLLGRMLMDPKPLPTKRKSPDQVKKDLAREKGVADALRFYDFKV